VSLERSRFRSLAAHDRWVEAGCVATRRRIGLYAEVLHAAGELLTQVEADLRERRVARHDEAVEQRTTAPLTTEVAQRLTVRLGKRDLADHRELRVDIDVVL